MKAGLEYALTKVHQGENRVAEHLQVILERHPSDHEVHHVAIDLLRWSRENVRHLADAAAAHDVHLSAEAGQPSTGEALARASTVEEITPLTLLDDIRALYLLAAETSLDWEMLAQHAQAAREGDLLQLSKKRHPQTQRQMKWANTMLKVRSPQTLASMESSPAGSRL